jgi:hypothetical protein
LALSAATSAALAMPGIPSAGGGPSVVLVDCAWGWYRGPDGRCYISGRGPQYRGDGIYYGHRDWRGGEAYDEYYPPAYPRYRYYRPPVIEDDDY